jgi:DNA modification methylase
MTNWLDNIHVGDCRRLMRAMAADGVRVDCVVTSPPYWGLRDYGHPSQFGLERTWQRHVARMRGVFHLVRNLLAEDGVLWLNYGDSYAGRGGQSPQSGELFKGRRRQRENITLSLRGRGDGLKEKDLIGMPWRVAFALQADGWYLRSDVIWAKPNPMPESVLDRPTKSHEYLFLMAKSPTYHYDARAIAEPITWSSHERLLQNIAAQEGSPVPGRDGNMKAAAPKFGGPKYGQSGEEQHRTKSGNPYQPDPEGLRNARSVWPIATAAFPGAHFATFPPALVRRCILAGSRPGDIVFDPFMGSGTVAEVALSLGRRFVGCELNPEYAAMFESHRSQQQGFPV